MMQTSDALLGLCSLRNAGLSGGTRPLSKGRGVGWVGSAAAETIFLELLSIKKFEIASAR